MTKLTALTPAIVEAVIYSVTLSVMITATVGTVIKLIKCPKCKTEYSDRISNNCLHCGTELPEEKEKYAEVDTSLFKQLHDELNWQGQSKSRRSKK